MNKYEKPLATVAEGASEGVFLASGVACDCFSVKINSQSTNGDSFTCFFDIYHNASHAHVVDNDWSNVTVTMTFKNTVPPTATVSRIPNATISGNVVTALLASVIPAEGDKSYNSVMISGSGAGELVLESITASH